MKPLTHSEERLVHSMQLLGDGNRFKMFKLLTTQADLCVSEIADLLNISVSAVSQQFKHFEVLGIVSKKRTGQKICYELRYTDSFVQQLITLTKGEK